MEAKEYNDQLRKYAVYEEIETSVRLIHLGFGEIQNIGWSNNFYFLPFQLLSQGFERLLKAYICIGVFNKIGDFPDSKLFSEKLKHDLIKLLDLILAEHFEDIGDSDKDLLSSNAELRELISILSEFGKYGRYCNFDLITNSPKQNIDPTVRWAKFESTIPSKKPISLESLMNWDTNHELFGEVSRYIIILFEKFISALSKQFVRGCLGALGKRYSAPLMDFAMLYGDKFGVRDYRISTLTFNSTEKRVHKRTEEDEYERRNNPEFKWKVIKKSEFKGDWPFLVDEVIVESRYGYWCIITIEGQDYALNTLAKGRYKLDSPHDAGMAIIGKSLGPFIEIANSL